MSLKNEMFQRDRILNVTNVQNKKLSFNPVNLPCAGPGLLKDPAVPNDLSALACDDPLKKLLR